MPASALPVRQVFDLVVEMQLSCCAATHRVLQAPDGRPVPLNRAAYLLLILRCNQRFHRAGAGVAKRPGGANDGISVSAVAASFEQPFETARRHANELIKQGFCVRQGLRICIRSQQFETASFKQFLTDLHDIMVRFVKQLRGRGIELPAGRDGIGYDRDATVAAALDLTLAAYDYGTPFFASWLEMRVMCAMIGGNARAVTADLVQPQPDIAPGGIQSDVPLRPVSARAIARVLNISEATARRQLRIAHDRGLAIRQGSGFVRTRKALETPALIDLPQHATLHALRTIQRLGASGFHFDNPASHYIGDEPPMVDFD